MSWFDILKGLIPDIKNINSKIKVNSDNKKQELTYVDNSKHLTVNFAAADKVQKDEIKALLAGYFQETGMLIGVDTEETLQSVKAYEERAVQDGSLLDFFKGKIPDADLEILRASLYLKDLLEGGKQVGTIKENILRKHGERGNKISNLCTAGYYHNLIKPLYEAMAAQPNFTSARFDNAYQLIVTQHHFALFVSHSMTIGELQAALLSQIEKNKRYGVNYINIHGIGRDNVEKIQAVLQVEEVKKNFSSPPDLQTGRKYLTATVYFDN